jgi:hypothetical protein
MVKKGQSEVRLRKTIFAAVLTVVISAALWPQATPHAFAQSADAAKAETKAAATKKPPNPAQVALRERQKKCGAEWKAAKAAGTIEKGMKWPQYWSACNKRLKSGG